MSAATTLENGFTSGLKTLKEAIAYRWSKDIWRDDMSKLLEKDLFSLWNRTKHEKAKGTVMLFNTAITVALFLQGCAIANSSSPQNSGWWWGHGATLGRYKYCSHQTHVD